MRERFQQEIAQRIARKTGGKVQLRPDQVVIASARAGSLIVDVNITGLSEQEVAELVAETIQVSARAPALTPLDSLAVIKTFSRVAEPGSGQ